MSFLLLVSVSFLLFHAMKPVLAQELTNKTDTSNATGKPVFTGVVNVKSLPNAPPFNGSVQVMPEEVDEKALLAAKARAESERVTTKGFTIRPPSSLPNATLGNKSPSPQSSSPPSFSHSNNPTSYSPYEYILDQHPSIHYVQCINPPCPPNQNGPNSNAFVSSQNVSVISSHTIFQALPGFDGIGSHGPTPPDVQIAAGPNHIVEMVNRVVGIYDKNEGLIEYPSIDSFFCPPPVAPCESHFLTDPRVLYDRFSHTWFAAVLDLTSHSIRVAVSSSDNPLSDTWLLYNFPFNDPYANHHRYDYDCPDQPTIGVSEDKFVVSVNNWSNNCGAPGLANPREPTEFLGAQYTVVDKSDLISNDPNPRFYHSLSDISIFSLHPITSLSLTSNIYMVSVVNDYGGQTLKLNTLTGNAANVLTRDIWNIPIQRFIVPINAEQRDSTHRLDAGDNRAEDAIFYEGNIWIVFNDGCMPDGDTSNRACFRVVEIDPIHNRVIQDFDIKPIRGSYIFYPAIAANNHNLAIVYGRSSANSFPSLEATAKLTTDDDSIGVQDPSISIIRGSGSVGEDQCNEPSLTCSPRYGDYFGAAADPSNSCIVWVAGEYQTSLDPSRWSTFIGKLSTTLFSDLPSCTGKELPGPVRRPLEGPPPIPEPPELTTPPSKMPTIPPESTPPAENITRPLPSANPSEAQVPQSTPPSGEEIKQPSTQPSEQQPSLKCGQNEELVNGTTCVPQIPP